MFKAIRGATIAKENKKQEIISKTKELLNEIISENKLKPNDIVSAFFTMTEDLNATFPAAAARELGWTNAALLCAREINVPGSLPSCIRVLIHCNLEHITNPQNIYLYEAKQLRADL